MNQTGLSRTGIKTASEKTQRTAGSVFGWPDVLRVLQDDEARSYATTRYRAAGFGPDDFARSRAAREAMADALTRTEDWLEMLGVDGIRRGAKLEAERAAIRDVRRRLETELWP